jgi:hypothetical protein
VSSPNLTNTDAELDGSAVVYGVPSATRLLEAQNGAFGATRARYRIDLVTIAAANVKLLHSTPYTLVASQGSGTIINVHRISFASTFVSVAYTGANNLEFRYTGASGAKVVADIAAATLNFASGTKYALVAGVTTELTQVANSPIVVVVPTADPGAGDSIINFYVEYTVLTAP